VSERAFFGGGKDGAHDLTIADVRRHSTIEPGGNGWEWWSCGCHVKHQRRNWCPYHQGFFDGVEAAQHECCGLSWA
jgi:hypothetical protein